MGGCEGVYHQKLVLGIEYDVVRRRRSDDMLTCCDKMFRSRKSASRPGLITTCESCQGPVARGDTHKERERERDQLLTFSLLVRTQEFGQRSVVAMARLQEPSGTE